MAAADREDLVEDQTLRMAVDIVTAYLSNNSLPAATIPDLIATVHGALSNLGRPSEEAVQASRKPAVPIRKSVTPDYIVCLEDGKRLKMLKRYLRSNFGMTIVVSKCPSEKFSYTKSFGHLPKYSQCATLSAD